MPPDPDRVAGDIAAIRETLAGIGLDDSAQGDAADAVRRALTQHGAALDAIADAANAAAKAAADRERLVAQRDVEIPSDEQIHAAQEAVIVAAAAASAGTGSPDDVRTATDRLSDLLAQKKAAQDKFDNGEAKSAGDLDSATSDLPDAAGSPLGGMSPLSAILGTLQKLEPAGAPGGAPQAPATLAGATSPDGDLADMLDQLQSGDDDHLRTPGLTDPSWQPGEGQTHVSSDVLPAMPTISGAQTGADVSGRSANPFTVTPPPAEGGTSGPPGGAPMSPMGPMAPMGGRGGASAKGKGERIIREDSDFTGADIDRDVATSGVVGRGEGRR
jgi:hypothetical protein